MPCWVASAAHCLLQALHDPGLGMHAVGLLGQQGRPERAV